MRRTSENKINTVSDLNEIRARFSGAKSFLLDELEREGLRFGADVSAVVENRVVSTGKNDIGTPFSPYSTKRAPAYLYLGKSRNNRGEGAIKQRIKKKEGVSYREFRELNGLNADKKNFEFTGEMWQGFGVVSSRKIAAGGDRGYNRGEKCANVRPADQARKGRRSQHHKAVGGRGASGGGWHSFTSQKSGKCLN
jgi:hypothetical protein